MLYGDKQDVVARAAVSARTALPELRFMQTMPSRGSSLSDTPACWPEQVPKVYWHASSARVLTMEWVTGTKLSDLESLRAQARKRSDAFHISRESDASCKRSLGSCSIVLPNSGRRLTRPLC